MRREEACSSLRSLSVSTIIVDLEQVGDNSSRGGVDCAVEAGDDGDMLGCWLPAKLVTVVGRPHILTRREEVCGGLCSSSVSACDNRKPPHTSPVVKWEGCW